MSLALGVVSCLFTFVWGMLLVAYFILSERQVLGYIQLRKGPNKVGLWGLLQSFGDFLKLITKLGEDHFNTRSWLSRVGLALITICMFGFCSIISGSYGGVSSELYTVWLLVVSSIGGYSIVSMGWGSFNKYALMSSIRSCFSAVSFEAVFMCVVIQVNVMLGDYCIQGHMQNSLLYGLLSILFIICWLLVVVSDGSRPPFDYLEAESEMVSGVNVEYGGISFTCLFASEYFIVFSLSWFTSVLFMGGGLTVLGSILVLYFFIISRGSYPRARFDYFAWFMWEYCVVVAVVSFLLVV